MPKASKKKYEFELTNKKIETLALTGARGNMKAFPVNVRLFKLNKVLFGYATQAEVDGNPHVEHQITHIKSGKGIPMVNFAKVTTKNIEEKMLEMIEHRGRRFFWELIRKQVSVDEALKEDKEYNRLIHEKVKVLHQLRNICHITIPYCRTMLVGGRVGIDIVKFDDNLKKTYPKSYPDGMSMKEFVTKQWGQDFAEKLAFVI